MTPPKKETAQEKFQRLREKNKADMMEKLERIQTQQKAVALHKSQQKGKEVKATAEGQHVKKTEEKPGFTPERKVHIGEKARVNGPKKFKPLASHSPTLPNSRLRNAHVSDSELSMPSFVKMHDTHQRCTNCCGGLPGRGPGSGRIGGGGYCCGITDMDSDYENCRVERLRGGGDSGEFTCEKSPERFRGGCGGGCSQSSKPSFSPCVQQHIPRNQSYPPPCWRSHRWQAPCQKHESQQMGMRGNAKSNCPCGSCGGPGCYDNPGRQNDGGCCSPSQSKGAPCKCKCKSHKSFQPEGGCGGQSCGKMYSCSGSGGGGSCFPRNYRRREDAQCCGGTSPQHRSGCC